MAEKTQIISFEISDGRIIKVEITPIGEQTVSAETKIFSQATEIIKSLNTQIAEKVLTRLLRYHILQRRNGGCNFEILLLKQWVRDRAVKS